MSFSVNADFNNLNTVVRKPAVAQIERFLDKFYYRRINYSVAMDNPVKSSKNFGLRDRIMFHGNIFLHPNDSEPIGTATYIYTVINVVAVGDDTHPTTTEGTISRIIRITNHPKGMNGNIYLYSYITYHTLLVDGNLISNSTDPSDDSVTSGNASFRGLFGNCSNSNLLGVQGVTELGFDAEFQTGRQV
jgi:hypothetical protein